MKKTSKRTTATTVDEYLAMLPEQSRVTLEKVRKTIKATAPKAEEVISYQIPMYKYKGPVAAIAGFANHCSYFATSHAIIKTFKDELKPYDVSGVTIRFPVDKPLPATLVKKLVRAKIKENEERAMRKQK